MDAAALHREAVVVDCHNDLPMVLLLHERSLGAMGRQGYLAETWIPEFRAGGVDVQVVPVYLDPSVAEGALRHALLALEAFRREVERSPGELALCESFPEIEVALGEGKVALLLALEGTLPIGADVELFGTFHRLGVRMVSFTHLGRTPLADGSGEDAAGSRLPAAGVEAVAELERLGIVLDLSHLSLASVDHALELVTKPVVASHSSARALHDHHRNLPDEQLRGIAATGGVVGVNSIPHFLAREGATIDTVCDHLEHVASVAGIDHVGLGPDFIKEYFDALYPSYDRFELVPGVDVKEAIPGLVSTRDLPNLTARLLERGFVPDDVRKILGANFMRVFGQIL